MTKQLTQDVFSFPDCPPWVMSAAVNDDGEAWVFNCPEAELIIRENFGQYWDTPDTNDAQCYCIGKGYDTTNWQESAINRE